MQDGVVYGLFNHQGGPRGGDEFVVPNWWMGMLMRETGRHRFGLNAMLSLDPATVGSRGYRKIFQVGEVFDGKPLIDRQHPHDFFMQLAATWQTTTRAGTILLAGGPAGEPTLGPVAFMHRPSAAGLPFAPLGHHTFDSTHISFGVVAAGITHRQWTFEGSVFNAREPDQHRWDFDLGALDSIAGRIWFRPTAAWEAQISTSRLRDPEALTGGDVYRTTASVSRSEIGDLDLSGFTAAYGVNAAHGERRHGVFAELTLERGALSWFGRAEIQQLEIGPLVTGEAEGHASENEESGAVKALTLGAARRLGTWRGFDAALAAQLGLHLTPEPLEATHGRRPISFQAFLRLRLPTGGADRMWNMRMTKGH
jgi:hypothetical protein